MSRQASATVVRTAGSAATWGVLPQLAGTVAAVSASTRRRSRAGITWITLASARIDASAVPPAAPCAAICRPTARATASSSSTTSGGSAVPGGQLVAAVHPPLGLDRVAELAQPVDVPAQGPRGHLQPLGQLGARPVPAALQQGQQPQRPGTGVSHVSIFA